MNSFNFATRWGLCLALLLLFTAPAAHATTWNAADGDWSYGWEQGSGGTFNLLTRTYIPGADLGTGGRADNLVWASFNITNQTGPLFDGNPGNHGSALYVGGILGVLFDPDRCWSRTFMGVPA